MTKWYQIGDEEPGDDGEMLSAPWRVDINNLVMMVKRYQLGDDKTLLTWRWWWKIIKSVTKRRF